MGGGPVAPRSGHRIGRAHRPASPDFATMIAPNAGSASEPEPALPLNSDHRMGADHCARVVAPVPEAARGTPSGPRRLARATYPGAVPNSGGRARCGSEVTRVADHLWMAPDAPDRSRFGSERGSFSSIRPRHVRQPSRLRPLPSRALRRAPVLGLVPGGCAAAVLGDHLIRQARNKKHPGSGGSQGVADLAASLIGLGMRRSADRLLSGGGER